MIGRRLRGVSGGRLLWRCRSLGRGRGRPLIAAVALLQAVDADAVDQWGEVSPHWRDLGHRRVPLVAPECVVAVPNTAKVWTFDWPRVSGARVNPGVLCAVQKLKRFDVALDILDRVRDRVERHELDNAFPASPRMVVAGRAATLGRDGLNGRGRVGRPADACRVGGSSLAARKTEWRAG